MGFATLLAMTHSWTDTLRHSGGVCPISDESDGARHVGPAYGAENLLGRWQPHIEGEAGLTRQLSRRNPARFRRSVPEVLSPAAGIAEVTRIEPGWIDRLHTRRFDLKA